MESELAGSQCLTYATFVWSVCRLFLTEKWPVVQEVEQEEIDEISEGLSKLHHQLRTMAPLLCTAP